MRGMRTDTRHMLRGGVIVAAFAASLLLTIALANAQEPPESQTATRLEPGINLVGWVGEPTSVSQLFDEIPQLESVWAWDAELDDWIVAGRGAPEWLGGLGRVWAGMGLRLILGGDESFLWQRSTAPTRGLVELRTGWNLVAWSGADGAPLEQVAKGIGWSLRELRRWDAANQQWATWTSPERSAQLIAASAADQGGEVEPATVRRGEALWVNVARSVNWLQPTDILPRLIFPGGASDELRARVREDLESVLAFFGQQYGIQADPDFTVYVAKDVDALVQAYKDDGEDALAASAASIRALWNRAAGWLSGGIVVKQAPWPEDQSTSDISWARYTLTHEYFHILQQQLSDRWASQWLVEGTADWVQGGHQVLDGEQTLEDLRERELSKLSSRTPTLRSAESDNAQWHYTLGWLAVDRLTAAGGDGSYVEFWRQLASTEIGPHGRWTSRPDWRTAFQETFGLPVSSFYADFDAWQRGQAATNGVTASSTEGDARWIRGRVTDENGAPVVGVFVNAIRVEGSVRVDWNHRAETGTNGAFAVRVPQDGDYRVTVDIADECATRYYYSDGRLLDERNRFGAHPAKVAGSDLRNIEIQLPPNVCTFIRGRITTGAGQPLADVSVSACEIFYSDIPHCTSGHTASDGSFAVPAAVAGEYHLRLDLAHGCSAYYGAGSAVARQSKATPIGVFKTDSPHLLIRVSEDLCAYRIRGTFADSDGQTLADVSITACYEHYPFCSRNTDTENSFTITVPTEGRYRLRFSNPNGCSRYFSGQRQPAVNRGDAWLVDVARQDVRLALPVSKKLCHQISGRLVSASGAPLAEADIEASVQVCEEVGDVCYGGDIGPDGLFAITVPIDGRYRVTITVLKAASSVICSAYFGQEHLTTDRSDAWLIDVAGQDVRLPPRQVSAGLCGQ